MLTDTDVDVGSAMQATRQRIAGSLSRGSSQSSVGKLSGANRRAHWARLFTIAMTEVAEKRLLGLDSHMLARRAKHRRAA